MKVRDKQSLLLLMSTIGLYKEPNGFSYQLGILFGNTF
jgi:hypothetical protein